MSERKIKIVADSSSNLMEMAGILFKSVPLKIITSEREFVDDSNINLLDMVNYLHSYKGKSSTACPNAGEWMEAFGDAEEVFCITITGTLSGSYAAAMMAKQEYEEKYPERRVYVINSLSAGAELVLMADKIKSLADENKTFDEIVEAMEDYCNKTGLLFMLESMQNLANNGRVSPMVAKMAGMLGIRVVGKASDRGDLEPLDKCRGENKAFDAIIKHLKAHGFNTGRVSIAHCFNENGAKKLKEIILKEFSKASVDIHICRGLCSFYAEKGGLMIGFEKM